MKIRNINRDTRGIYESIKQNGKRLLCLVGTIATMAMPMVAGASESQETAVPASVVQSLNDVNYLLDAENDIVFEVISEWIKTDNYNDGQNLKGENREYYRTITQLKAKKVINPEYFKSDYKKVLEYIRDYEDFEKAFEVLGTTVETITVTKSEERNLDQEHMTLEIEGTDIRIIVDSKEVSERNAGFIGLLILYSPVLFLLLVAMIGEMADYISDKKWKRKCKQNNNIDRKSVKGLI